MSTTSSMTPASRPRRGVLVALAVAGGVAATAALVVAGPADRAAASELRAFSSCQAMAAWGEDALSGGDRFDGDGFVEVGDAVEESALVAPDDASSGAGSMGVETAGAAPSTTAAMAREDEGDADTVAAGDGSGADDSAGDTTNVVVEGVDELDLVDRLAGDVWLVTTSGRLAIVDLAAGEARATHPVPYDAQVTFDRERDVAWVVGHLDAGGVVVERVAVDDGSLTSDGRWATTGHLVDARRVGGALHLVATEGFAHGGPMPVDIGDEAVSSPGFAGEGDDGAAPSMPTTMPPSSTSVIDGPDDAATTTTLPEPVDPEQPTDPEETVPEETVPEEEEGETVPEVTEPVEPEPIVPFPDGPVPCDEVLHPDGTSSPEATLLVTLPATGELEPTHATEVVGAGSQVLVTHDAAYLATALYDGEPATSIHRFDLGDLTHTGSGRVDGSMLDEFSMSEAGGHLRVAVTTGDDTFGVVEPAVGAAVDEGAVEGPAAAEEAGDPDDEREAPRSSTVGGPGARNEIVVLDTDGDLDVVGRTPRFGKPGESIHGIRFAGDVAYAVTFLQTDPFYVVDLTSPSAPEVVGEVELPGFSSYLHPLSDDLVVGFGPGEDGRPAAKLFDVSDPTAPRVADDVLLGDDSAVTWDHHAFLDLGDGRFAVPATTWTPEATRSEVVVLDASEGTFEEVERVGVDATDTGLRVLPAGEGWALLTGTTVEVLPGTGGATGSIRLL